MVHAGCSPPIHPHRYQLDSLQQYEPTSTGGLSWWPQLVVSTGGLSWWSQLVVSAGGLSWWSQLVVSAGGLSWWSHLVVSAGGLSWWSQLVVSTGTWWSQLVVSAGGLSWWSQLVVSAGSPFAGAFVAAVIAGDCHDALALPFAFAALLLPFCLCLPPCLGGGNIWFGWIYRRSRWRSLFTGRLPALHVRDRCLLAWLQPCAKSTLDPVWHVQQIGAARTPFLRTDPLWAQYI